MKHTQKILAAELRIVGASNAELEQLLPIAANLSELKYYNTAVSEPPSSRGLQRFLRSIVYAAPVLVVGMFLIITSQTVLPTSRLYPLQKLSDDVAMSVHPQYRATVMMRRAGQVNRLVAEHADSHVVLATLADYTNVAGSYKSAAYANYTTFKYCEASLRQASGKAPPRVRQAIANSLWSVESS
jgi:hypothetical protein